MTSKTNLFLICNLDDEIFKFFFDAENSKIIFKRRYIAGICFVNG